MKKIITLTSPLNGRFYKLAASEVAEFYEEHVLGSTDKFRKKMARAGSSLPVVGTVLLQLFNGGGDVIDARAGYNLVTDAGRGAAIDRLQGTSVGVCDFVAIGTGATAAAAGDTTLQTEIGTRVQGALTQPTAFTDRVVSTFAAANGTGAITECGRLSASSGGVLFGRQVFSVINKGASDSLQVQYDITD
jgi:hypothetical protein